MIASFVKKLILDKGRTFTLKRPSSASSYNKATGDMVINAVTISSAARGVFLQYQAREMANTLIKAGDLKVVIDPGTIDPDVPMAQDLVISDGTLRILNVQRISDGTAAVVYVCQCRS